MATRLDGRQLAATIEERLQAVVAERLERAGRPPGLAVLRVGDDPASGVYVANKEKACSRIGITNQLITAMADATRKPAVFLSGSAIGIYGDTGSVDITEQAPAADDFGARLCAEWELAALPAEALEVRVCLLRTGLVMHADGGMLKKMQLPFKLGLGSRLGDGRQIMSWIHRHDYLNALLFLLDDPECRGAFNLTAPTPVSNRAFTAELARSLQRKAFLVTPEWALKPVLGERSLLLFGGQRALPKRLMAKGFRFRFTGLATALAHASED